MSAYNPFSTKTYEPEKLAAFFAEFDFLHKYAKAKDVQEVEVRRWDKVLLNWEPFRRNEEGVWCWTSTIRFLDVKGDTVGIVGELTRRWWNPFSWGRKNTKVFQAIPQLGGRARMVMTVVIFQNFYGKSRVTVYKAPRGMDSLETWYESQLPN